MARVGLQTILRQAGALAALLAALLLHGGAAFATPAPAPAPARELVQAVRTAPGSGPVAVTLPDRLNVPTGAPRLRPTYAIDVDLGPVTPGLALYVPGLLNKARVRVNGHVVVDTLADPTRLAPRGADRLLLLPLLSEILVPGVNRIEIALEAPRWTSLSPAWIGPEPELRRAYERQRWWQVYAPVVVASLTFSLSVCVLLLWARQRQEALYGYFGIGGVIWSLHSVWGVLPDPLLPYPHFAIWWNFGFGCFIAPIVVFCVRLAQWRVPRLERAMWLLLGLGPLIIYGGYALDRLDATMQYWRLAWIGAVALGAVAVGYFAAVRRDLHALLLITAAATAFAFGLYDWLAAIYLGGSNPIVLTHFSGLVFFPLVVSMLIDGFVRATRDLERLNADLERRVAEKSRELMSALDAMRIAKDGAESANRAKSSFLAAASHDLRQPMHALGLYMAALRAETSASARVDLIDRMSASVGALDTLFDTLLDVSRIDAGAIEPRPGSFALGPMLHRLADEFAAQAADQGLRLSVRLPPAAQQLGALSDPLLVERILRNLLANAVKYTRDGGVLLACRLRHDPTGARHWRIEVWDTGPGIPEAEFEHVFEEFYQLGNPERNRAAGLGLGLSIVRRLTRLLGHRLALHSLPGHGSRFSIELPVSDDLGAPTPATAPATATGSDASLDRLVVAVIDDDPEVRDSMTALLTRWGCDVVAGATGEEVLARAGTDPRRRLQAAVVDYQLRDGRNGIDAISALRDACGARLPALVVSGASSAARLAEVKASGHAWLSKPVPAARLRHWLLQAAAGATA